MIDPEEHQKQVLEMFKHKNECDEIDLNRSRRHVEVTIPRALNYLCKEKGPCRQIGIVNLLRKRGAGDGDRTRNIQLGKLALYH